MPTRSASGAALISLRTDPANGTLTIVDDGRGMQRRELAISDVAASSKAGGGIGFAGVGIKLGLLVSREVITETSEARRTSRPGGISRRGIAPHEMDFAPGLAGARGTAVRLVLTNQLSPLTDAGYVEEVIRRHFEPLFDPDFDEFVRRKYRAGVGFEVDGRHLPWTGAQGFERAPVSLRMDGGGHRLRSGFSSDTRSRRSIGGHRHQHVRQGHQARLGLAWHHARESPHRRIDRGSGSGCLSHAQQERLHPNRHSAPPTSPTARPCKKSCRVS